MGLKGQAQWSVGRPRRELVFRFLRIVHFGPQGAHSHRLALK